jgi:hypothetical protein
MLFLTVCYKMQNLFITDIIVFESQDNVVNVSTHFGKINLQFLDHGDMAKSCVYLVTIYLTPLSLALIT